MPNNSDLTNVNDRSEGQHLTENEKAQIKEILDHIPIKSSRWKTVEEMVLATYPIHREAVQSLIREIHSDVHKAVSNMAHVANDYPFASIFEAYDVLCRLPPSILFLVGAIPRGRMVSNSYSSSVESNDTTFKHVGEIAGEVVEDCLRFLHTFMVPSVGPNNVVLYWPSVRLKLRPLIQMGFIKEQHGLAVKLLEVLACPTSQQNPPGHGPPAH